LTVQPSDRGDDRLFVEGPDDGIPLTVDGRVVLRLFLTYRCAWDHTGQFLAVRWSTVSVAAEGVAEPLFRYDYDEASDGRVPAAHLDVHGHRDELVFAMLTSGRRLRGKPRAASVRRGRVPRVSTLHFPLGGHRFRPALEDVLEMVVRGSGSTPATAGRRRFVRVASAGAACSSGRRCATTPRARRSVPSVTRSPHPRSSRLSTTAGRSRPERRGGEPSAAGRGTRSRHAG
jgi:hypothetical protein